MKRAVLFALLLMALVVPSAQGVIAPSGPDSDVPEQHWAYDAIRMFAQWGLWHGFPYGTYSGKRAMTRREFAESTCDIAGAASELAGEGWPDRSDLVRGWKPPDPLTRLAREFQPELALIGADGEPFRDEVRQFAQVWRDGRPQGVQAPLVTGLQRYYAVARTEGKHAAVEEWRAGKALLWIQGRLPDLRVDLWRAIPLVAQPNEPDDAVLNQRIAGHNAEVWRLLRERGSPAESHLEWTRLLFDLRAWWRQNRAKSVLLNGRYPGAVLPGDSLDRWESSIWWEIAYPERKLSQAAATGDGRIKADWSRTVPRQRLLIKSWPLDVALAVPGLPGPKGSMRVVWGPAGSGVALIRIHQRDDSEMPYRLYAVDLRTGRLLNAEAAEE